MGKSGKSGTKSNTPGGAKDGDRTVTVTRAPVLAQFKMLVGYERFLVNTSRTSSTHTRLPVHINIVNSVNDVNIVEVISGGKIENDFWREGNSAICALGPRQKLPKDGNKTNGSTATLRIVSLGAR